MKHFMKGGIYFQADLVTAYSCVDVRRETADNKSQETTHAVFDFQSFQATIRGG
jgi:hypothetical protein